MTLKLPTIAKPNVVSSAGVGNFDPVGTLVNLCFYYLGPEKPPTFDPYECTVLTHQVEEDVAAKYIQKEFEPRYTFVDKKIEQLTEESSLGEMVHMLYILSIMEKGALEWKDKHTVSNIATPRAVHLLYTKLFDKIETAFPPQTNNLPLEQITCSLPKLAGNDDAHSSLNAALQMLFSNYELAKDLVYSTNQNAHLRHAFALFQKAAQGYLKAPIDLATTLYPFYSSTQEKESSADLISKMLAPLPDNSELLHELAINSGENGVQYVKQAVCTLDIKDETNQSLEILLFTSFNQILDEDGTSAIQTRFVSAPKFLFFNLNRKGVSDKGSALSGVQRTFFLPSELVRDQKGASYSLQSFNVQQGSRYIHYREASAKFYRFEDDHVEEITELKYLAEAQKAYVMIFQRDANSPHPLVLYQGIEENAARFQSMQLIHFAIHALRGGKTPSKYPLIAPLQRFMESLLGSTPNKEAFETLDPSLQNAALFLWSKTQLLDDMISYLDDQKKSPQLLCYSEFDPYLYGNSARLVTMIDLFAQKIHAFPLIEEHDALLAIITATSAISNNLQDSAVIRTSITREVGQLALSSAVFTVTCWKGGKEINLKSLVASSAFLMQCLSSTKNVLFTYFDPRNQNKKLQFIERHVQPLTQVGRALLTPYFMPNCDPAKWKDALPFVSPLIQDAFSLGNYYLQKPIIPQSYQNYLSSGVNFYLGHRTSLLTTEKINHGVSTTLSLASSFFAPIAQGEVDPLKISTKLEMFRSNFFHVVLTNSSLQNLITNEATARIIETYYIPPLQKAYYQKSRELDEAIENGDEEQITKLLEELALLGNAFKDIERKLDLPAIKKEVEQKKLLKSIKDDVATLNQQNIDFEQKTESERKAILENTTTLQKTICEKAESLKKLGCEVSQEFLDDVNECVKQLYFEEYNIACKKLDESMKAKNISQGKMHAANILAIAAELTNNFHYTFSEEALANHQQLKDFQNSPVPSPADYALLKDHQARTQNLITLKEQALESETKKLKDCNDAVSASNKHFWEKKVKYEEITDDKHAKKDKKNHAKDSYKNALAKRDTQVDIKNKQDGVVNGIQQELNALAQESQEYQEALAQMNASLDDTIAAVPTEKTLELIEKTLHAEKALSKSPNDIHAQNVASLQKQSQAIRTQLSLPPMPPLPINLSLSISVKKIHGTHTKEHLVYIESGHGQHKQIGKFSNETAAKFFQSKYHAYLKRLNEQNQEIAETQAYYNKLGMDPADIATLSGFEPIPIEISACGSVSNVYQGDQKVKRTKSRNEASERAFKIMEDHIQANDQTIQDFKAKMADKIFATPSTPEFVKVSEVQRIINEQHQDEQAKESANQKKAALEKDLKDAQKKCTTKAKRQRKEMRYEKDLADREADGFIKKIENNNFTLQIAQGNTTREEVNHAKQRLKEAEKNALYAPYILQDSQEEFQETKKDRDHKQLVKDTNSYNEKMREKTDAINLYNRLQGSNTQYEAPTPVQAPGKASKWEKTKAWINNNVSGSGEVNLVTISGPNTPTAPSLMHIKVDSKKPNLTTRTTHSAPEPATAPSSHSESASLPQEETQTTTTTTTTTLTPAVIANLEFYDPFYVPPPPSQAPQNQEMTLHPEKKTLPAPKEPIPAALNPHNQPLLTPGLLYCPPPPSQFPSFHPEKTLSSITEPTAEKNLHDTPQTTEPFITKENLKVAVKDSLKPGPSNFLGSIITQKVQQSVNKYTADLANQGKSDSGVHEIGTRQLSKGLIMSIGGINTDLKEHMQAANQMSAAANGAKVTIVYNATHSPWVDVPECVAARMGYQMPPVQHLKNCWNEFIVTHGPDEKIFIRCHSNGAQYVKQALESSPKSVRERIIVLAIAPAVIIPKSLCFDSFNYVSRRDFVTHLDINGKIMYGKELHILEPHVEANRFDHSSLSPTFKEIEKYHIDEYLEGCENK